MAYASGGGCLGYHLGILYGKPTILPSVTETLLRSSPDGLNWFAVYPHVHMLL